MLVNECGSLVALALARQRQRGLASTRASRDYRPRSGLHSYVVAHSQRWRTGGLGEERSLQMHSTAASGEFALTSTPAVISTDLLWSLRTNRSDFLPQNPPWHNSRYCHQYSTALLNLDWCSLTMGCVS